MAWDFDPSYFRMNNIFGANSPTMPDAQPYPMDENPYGGYGYGDNKGIMSPKVKRKMDEYTSFKPAEATLPQTSSYKNTQEDESPEATYMKRFNQMVDTSGPAQTAYGDYVKTTPKREDYEPSKFRRFMAALSGGAAGYRNPAEGIRVASTINDDPYNEAIGDWQTKGKGLEAAAQEERQSLTARRGLMHDILYDNLGRRKQTLAEQVAPSIIDKNEGAAAQSTAVAADTKAKTADRPAELDIKKRQAEAKIGLDDAMTNLRTAQATGEPDIIAAMKDRAKAALIAAQAAGVTAAANTVKADAAKTIADRGPAAKGQPIMKPTAHSPAEETAAKNLAIQNVVSRNNVYSKFVEKDKSGGITSRVLEHKEPGFFGTDDSKERRAFQDAVDKETQAILARTQRTHREGTSYGTDSTQHVRQTGI